VLALALAMSVLAGYTPLTALVFASSAAAAIPDGALPAGQAAHAVLALAGCLWAALGTIVQLWPPSS